MNVGDRVAWYRYDDHLTARQRYGEVMSLERDQTDGLTTVRWDDGNTSEVFSSYLEPEAEVREFFRVAGLSNRRQEV